MAYWCDSCGREVSEYTGDPRMCLGCGGMVEWKAERLRGALRRAHNCATLKEDGTCLGCFVSEALSSPTTTPAEGLREAHGWISLKEKEPKRGHTVAILLDGEKLVGIWTGERWFMPSFRGSDWLPVEAASGITHWMALRVSPTTHGAERFVSLTAVKHALKSWAPNKAGDVLAALERDEADRGGEEKE